MGSRLKLAACLAICASFATTVESQPLAVSANFGADTATFVPGWANGSLGPTDSAGVLPAINWNNLSGPNGTVSFLANDGTTPGGSVTWGGPGNIWANTGGTATTPDQTMMYGYVDAGSGGPLTATFTSLPASISSYYNVYVYVAGDSAGGRTGDYSIGGTTILATQGSNAGNGTSAYYQAGNGTAGNYIQFMGLSGSSFALLASQYSARSPVDGVEIVSTPKLTWTGTQSGN